MRLAHHASLLAWALFDLRADAFMKVPRFDNASNTPPPGSSFSHTAGPFMGAYRWTWSQYIIPTTVGTVHVTVDQAHNKTFSTTVYHTDFEVNGTQAVLTRTDVDAAGTVTGVASEKGLPNVTVAYPTTVFYPDASFTWEAVLPVTTPGTYTEITPTVDRSSRSTLWSQANVITDVGADGTCCLSSQTLVVTATHSPFPTDGPLDTADPSGWLYTLIGWQYNDPYTDLAPAVVSSLWGSQDLELGVTYAGCSHTYCVYSTLVGVAPADAVQTQANLLATTTTTLSASSSKTTPTAEPENQPTSKSASATKGESSPTPNPPASTSSARDASQSKPPSSTNAGAEATEQTGSTAHLETPVTTSRQPIGTPQQSAEPANSKEPLSTVTTSKPVIIVGSSSITQQSSSDFVIGSQTLRPGSTITIGEGSATTEVALHTSGSVTIVQIGHSESTLQDVPTIITEPASPQTTPQDIVIGSITLQPETSGPALVVGSQTLAPGSSITLGSGSSTTVVALRTSGSETVLQVGTQVTTLTSQAGATTTGIGGYVASGLGGGSQLPSGGEGTTASTSPTGTGIEQSNAAWRSVQAFGSWHLLWLAAGAFVW